MQKTVILLKPDCIEKNLAGEALSRFEKAGLKIRACKMMQLSKEILADHYSHLADKPFFPEIVSFMQSSPVIAIALEGRDAIAGVRELLGPTDSKAAPKGTIRGDLGTDKMRNIAHASDSEETAAAELKRFFAPGEIY
ncbi:MAG TPA: nucleoside-diphosphate kinase [Verrucomicrobiales bacterium]|nr:nucleoside-diphosphate kinase [Verrucomicrobiales bacterium]